MRTRYRGHEEDEHRWPVRTRFRVGEEVLCAIVPRIQNEFSRQLRERGVDSGTIDRAFHLAERIKHYPFDPMRVDGAWSRFTVRQLADDHYRRPARADRDDMHRAYALVWSAVSEEDRVSSFDDLRRLIAEAAARHPARTTATTQP